MDDKIEILVAKWGNSLAVRLPHALVTRLGLVEGGTLQLRAGAGVLSTVSRTPGGLQEAPVPYLAGPPAAHAVAVGKWGNSLAIRLPKALLDGLGLSEGGTIEVQEGEHGMLDISKQETIGELFDRMKSLRGMIPADFRFDRDEANGRVPHERD